MSVNNNLHEINLDVVIANQGGINRFAEEGTCGIRDTRTGRLMKRTDYGDDVGLNVKFTVESVFSKRETYFADGVLPLKTATARVATSLGNAFFHFFM